MKDLSIGILNELYGNRLTDKQRKIVEAYYDYDLSLGEIASVEGISRQAVMDSLKKSEKTLHECEDDMGLLKKSNGIKSIIEELLARESVASDPESVRLLSKMLELL